MASSRMRIAICLIAGSSAAVTACAAVIGIGDPGLDPGEPDALPFEASSPQDTSTVPPKDSSTPPVDSSMPPDAGGLLCGPTLSCDRAGVCCTYHKLAGGYKYGCAAGGCPGPDGTEDYLATMKCGRFADCPGQRCCIDFGQTQAVSACKASCTNGEFLLCDPPPAANTCPAGYDPCRAFSTGFPSAFGYCRPN